MFKKMIQEKREFRAYQKRVNELPEEYKKAMKAIENYMWNFAKGSRHVGAFKEYFRDVRE